ncbi:MAG TPA: hypothetical protein VHI53_12290 [Gaiellaceae bacterium]|nr:hypothetical protein [Gaiellaceae bacterium]
MRRRARAAVLVGVVAALVGVPLAASANPDVSGFELDGNAASSGAADWNALGSPLFSTGVITDGTGAGEQGFTTGGSKDTNDVSQWKWTGGTVTPAKDDIQHAYAAVYAEQGNLILYFGQDRALDKNGDANVGFWFLQNAVGLNGDGSFSGSHVDGDVLVQSEFTNGGDISGVQIYKWQSGGLSLVSNQAECTGGKLGTADACAIVNKGTISTNWAGDITSPYFFEGGLDLSALFPQSVPCFSTFLTNTRTSQSESAQLKDFAMGDIDTCGSIMVKKVTVPGGGGPFSFTTMGTGLSGFDLTGGGEKLFDKLQPGNYSVTESPLPAAWALDGIACSASGAGTSASTPPGGTANITLGFLGNAVCTYTNKRQPQLTLVKSVVNDNGGTVAPGAWTLGATGSSGSFSGTANTAAVTAKTVTAGVQYTLAESGGPAGYSASSWVCNGGSFAGPDKVTLGLGDDVTCTITNDDQPATLIVKKVVVNDNGGTKVASDFSYQVNGGAPRSFEADGQNDLSVSAGTYSVTEPTVAGYTTSYSNCSNLVIPNGGSATCTVTNNDQPATLIVKKVVVNDNGGTKVASDFSFQVNGGTAQAFEADGQNNLSVGAGTYSVTEPAAAGYTTSYSNCSNLVIPNGGSATCTITNDDQAATLIVIKHVVNDNGGTAKAQDFSFQVNGGAAQAFEADGQNDLTVSAGTYNVVEPAVAGYATTYQGCSNIVLTLGGTATCTVTNNDVPRGQGSISISKSANPTFVKEPGGQVTYSVTITNTSADVVVTVDNVVDDKFGDLDDDGGNGCFDVPINLVPGGKVNCTFSKTISGVGGTSHVNVVTVSAHDENGHSLTASDDARVDITPRLIDLVIVKDASSPTPLNGIVNYSLKVTNKGPETATDVQLADPAPAGITYLTASPSQGTCNVSAALVTCSLGSIATGQTVTVAVTGRATVVGTLTNTATVTGSGGRETNPADNVDTAVTVVPAPLRPPVVKPKPAPKPEVCVSLVVSPKMIKADGKPDNVEATVSAGKKRLKGAKVGISGAGVAKTARTNGKGVAVIRINPRKPGIITVTVVESNQHVCGPKRIGVVGVFLPPLTG